MEDNSGYYLYELGLEAYEKGMKEETLQLFLSQQVYNPILKLMSEYTLV